MIQSVARATTVLEILDAGPAAGLPLTRIAERAGLKAPATHNLLKTLIDLGYASQAEDSRRYALGPRALRLGHHSALPATLARVALPFCRDLHERVNETVVLALYRDGARHSILTIESSRELRVGAETGVDERLYDTATGRILLSRLSRDELFTFLACRGAPGAAWPEARSRRGLLSALASIRKEGAACFHSAERHVHALAVPVGQGNTELNIAVGVYFPAARFGPGRDGEITGLLRTAASGIAAELAAWALTGPDEQRSRSRWTS